MVIPKVSVICTVYKHEPYLRQCLDGIIIQKTTFPFEVLVNDDCSPDGSAAVIKEYEQRFPALFRCIYQSENQYSKGKSPWFDILFPMARGQYIAICEGDDYWIDPYKLQKQVDFLDNHPENIVCFHNSRIQYPDHWSLFNPLDESHEPSTSDIIKRRWFISTPSLMFRNQIGSFPERPKGTINDDFFLELMLAKEGKFRYLDDVMSVYRQSGVGMSSVLNSNQPEMINKLIRILQYVRNHYGEEYQIAFDESIRQYERERDNYTTEQYYENHLIPRLLRPKTYTRILKKWLRKKLSIS